MPFSAIRKDVPFSHGPHAGSTAAVHVPQNFNPTAPFALCVFLHGLTKDVPFENHIAMAVEQIKSSSTNCLLVAPRFGGDDDPGSFKSATGFSSFIADLKDVLSPLLAQAGMAPVDAASIADYAAAKAPIVIVAFSGGWKPLNAMLEGLLTNEPASKHCADRVVGVALLDSIYGPISSAGIVKWTENRRKQTALLSIYGRHTGDDAPQANANLMAILKATGPVLKPTSWLDLPTFPAGTVAFFDVETTHLSIPRDGPPKAPVASFLTALGDRLAAFPLSS